MTVKVLVEATIPFAVVITISSVAVELATTFKLSNALTVAPNTAPVPLLSAVSDKTSAVPVPPFNVSAAVIDAAAAATVNAPAVAEASILSSPVFTLTVNALVKPAPTVTISTPVVPPVMVVIPAVFAKAPKVTV